jgi:hypothetical protein
MKEHNQGLFCNIQNLTSFSKKMRIISRIYNRWPPQKKSPIFLSLNDKNVQEEKKNWMQLVSTMATRWITALQLVG